LRSWLGIKLSIAHPTGSALIELRDRAGRVGERATQSATHSPLVEPEVRISRVRLS
jgi:hypothetical protein